jgi:hypothetical protein
VYLSCYYCTCIVWSNGLAELVIVEGAKRHRVAYVVLLCYRQRSDTCEYSCLDTTWTLHCKAYGLSHKTIGWPSELRVLVACATLE